MAVRKYQLTLCFAKFSLQLNPNISDNLGLPNRYSAETSAAEAPLAVISCGAVG